MENLWLVFFILTMHDLGWVNIFSVTWNFAVLVVWAALSGEKIFVVIFVLPLM